MNLKRIFGAVLTTLGILVLLYGGYAFINDASNGWKAVIVAIVLGIIFFTAGIGLVKNTRDEAV